MLKAFSEGNFIFVMLLLATLSGCATMRYLDPPIPPPPDVGLRASNDSVAATLHYRVVPDGPGSWVSGAQWIEFVISLVSQADVMVEKVSMVNSRGAFIGSLIKPGRDGDTVPSNPSIPWFDILPRVPGGILRPYFPGRVPGIITGIPIGGLDSVVQLIAIFGKFMQERDKKLIIADFNKKQLRTPTKLIANEPMRGSIFVPIDNYREMVIEYRTKKGTDVITLPLQE